jgi:60 kDa SS-A/Ro ribonucleoprotein
MNYLKQHGTRQTPQSQPIPGRTDQVQNTAGGHVWRADKWQRLNRFLILGSEGGSYYADQRTLTTENVSCVHECLGEDGRRVVRLAFEVSDGGRAPSNDPALFVLACAMSYKPDASVRLAAGRALPLVARTFTDLAHFVDYAQTMRGWGRMMRRAAQAWYLGKSPDELAYGVIKYRQRDGWTQRDVLRLAHPRGDAQHNAIFQWVTHGMDGQPESEIPLGHRLIGAFEEAQASTSPARTAALVRDHRLPREALLTAHLNDPDVWRALLEVGMPLHAMVRNLATMTRLGLFDDAELRSLVLHRLVAADYIRKSRLHPMALLIALRTYASGHGLRGGNTWQPHPYVIDALDEAFYLAFDNVQATGKRTLVAVDCSGSMWSGQVAGAPLTPAEAGVALALVTLHAEPECEVILVDDRAHHAGFSRRQRLDDAMRSMHRGGRTDMSVPFRVAKPEPGSVESFITITDNETWHGGVHPTQALAAYRAESGIAARSVAIAMVANRWSMADPLDALSLDVVGFDTATPQVVTEFLAGRA